MEQNIKIQFDEKIQKMSVERAVETIKKRIYEFDKKGNITEIKEGE